MSAALEFFTNVL